MGGTLSRIFHRKPEDENKPKVKKPRRFGSLRRQRTDDHSAGTRVSRSSTMPSRTHARADDETPALPVTRDPEEKRLEDRQEIMRDVMDSDETFTPVSSPNLQAQMPPIEPSHLPENGQLKPEIKAELPGGFVTVQLVSETSNEKTHDEIPESNNTPGVTGGGLEETEILRLEEHAEPIESQVDSHQQEVSDEGKNKISTHQQLDEEPITQLEELSYNHQEPTESEPAFENKDNVVSTKEDQGLEEEQIERFLEEQTELEQLPQQLEPLHSEATYDQAAECPILLDEKNTDQEFVQPSIIKTCDNIPAEKEEYAPIINVQNEQASFQASEEHVIAQEIFAKQDFENKHVDESSPELGEEFGEAPKEDDNKPPEQAQEVLDIHEFKQSFEHEMEYIAQNEDIDYNDEVVEEFSVEHAACVNSPQETLATRHSEQQPENGDEDEHSKELIGDSSHEFIEHNKMPQGTLDFHNSEQLLEIKEEELKPRNYIENLQEPTGDIVSLAQETIDIQRSEQQSDAEDTKEPAEMFNYEDIDQEKMPHEIPELLDSEHGTENKEFPVQEVVEHAEELIKDSHPKMFAEITDLQASDQPDEHKETDASPHHDVSQKNPDSESSQQPIEKDLGQHGAKYTESLPEDIWEQHNNNEENVDAQNVEQSEYEGECVVPHEEAEQADVEHSSDVETHGQPVEHEVEDAPESHHDEIPKDTTEQVDMLLEAIDAQNCEKSFENGEVKTEPTAEHEHNEHLVEPNDQSSLEQTNQNEEINEQKLLGLVGQDEDEQQPTAFVEELLTEQICDAKIEQPNPEPSEAGNESSSSVGSMKEDSNPNHTDNGCSEPIPNDGITNGQAVEHDQLDSCEADFNNDFNHSMEQTDVNLGDKKDPDSDVTHRSKLLATGGGEYIEDQHANGLPVNGEENLI